jgi:hypothetical protein
MSEWQPIETAPKDGTKIIAFHIWSRHIQMMTIAHWGRPGAYNAPCWISQGGTNHIDQPTHWMPLPEPPQ